MVFMNRAVACRPTQESCRRGPLARTPFRASHLHPLLLMSVASSALLMGVGGARAEDFNWTSTLVKEQPWETAANWASGGAVATTAPGAGGTVNISVGNTGIKSIIATDTVNLNAGTLWINNTAVLNASTVNGRLALSLGDAVKAQGTANISTLLNITGRTVDRYGLIDLGDSGTVTQSGGLVDNPIQIHTPTYTQTGGTMNAIVTGSAYALSEDGLVTGQVSSFTAPRGRS